MIILSHSALVSMIILSHSALVSMIVLWYNAKNSIIILALCYWQPVHRHVIAEKECFIMVTGLMTICALLSYHWWQIILVTGLLTVCPLTCVHYGDRFIDSVHWPVFIVVTGLLTVCPLTCVHCGDRYIDSVHWRVHCGDRFIDSVHWHVFIVVTGLLTVSIDMCSLQLQVYWQSVDWHVFIVVTGLLTVCPLTCFWWRVHCGDRFNNDPSIDMLLLTTHVGGLGLNLTGADTVIFVEHDWNPMKDLQVGSKLTHGTVPFTCR